MLREFHLHQQVAKVAEYEIRGGIGPVRLTLAQTDTLTGFRTECLITYAVLLDAAYCY
jgi:hypothetical protein